jgi:HlyD family secretion protein
VHLLRKNLFPAAIVLAVVVLLVLAFRPRPVRVEVARATVGPLRVTVDHEGQTRVRQRYVVTAPVTGRLERIRLDEGYPVEPGAVVARIYPTPLDQRTVAETRARLEAAEATKREADARVQQATAALDQARRSVNRARRLHRQGHISPEELELAELEVTTREKELAAANFAARAADATAEAVRAELMLPSGVPAEDAEVSQVEVRSPVQGKVLRVLEENERVVVTGTPLLELGDPSALEIVVDVLSEDAVRIQPGAPVLIEDWGGEGILHARVRLVEPSGYTKISALGVEEQRVNVIADFVDSVDSMGDGYRVEARIVVWEGEHVLRIPASALFRHDGDWNVFVVEKGRARQRRVDPGQRNPIEVEIRAGLKEGETVILHPSDLVKDGARVEVS